ncbi:hypothetical protein HMPREF3192_00912 [Atopobium deltae]|uniref:Uncharacterized protein n=1 Tax=Atopobium deltae TaxID=1393034 RepID=A0A133XTV0_9ACTN|nr:hypothetical protein HMPREF3192_00912 [Atopobium deltae]
MRLEIKIKFNKKKWMNYATVYHSLYVCASHYNKKVGLHSEVP